MRIPRAGGHKADIVLDPDDGVEVLFLLGPTQSVKQKRKKKKKTV